MQRRHHPVARDLGDDRGRGDGNRARIAVDQRVAGAGQGGRIIAVDQRERRPRTDSARTARAIARCVAWRILIRSISSTLASPTPTAIAFYMMWG